ncbi:hypothetical protein SmJEL517_g02493 [Synchytrium microbalum]|uniref:GCF C-terminal domain-containing protein n=1 Tax=Synchytrium microbalum TaxID=1806994 RepID=A0A507C6L2_9FUNG|nr:uncharacterized protein SmJEL517_g02493 [Synchytrium microbalum]TPX34988.1 hypothetical protein SmJEL517_g02493 [Synchytrium microbalum]
MNFGKGANKKNVRKKVVSVPDDDGSENNGSTGHRESSKDAAGRFEQLDITNEPIKRSMPSKSKAKSAVLSFGLDEEQDDGQAFRVSKSSESRRMAQNKLNLVPDNSRVSTTTTTADYSLAGLQALKLAQLNRPLRADPDSAMDIDSNGDSALPPIPVEPVIPDAAAVFAARKLREQRRNDAAGVGSGRLDKGLKPSSSSYISLDDKEDDKTNNMEDDDDENDSSRNESRLVTEDQEEQEDENFEDYEGDTITFGSRAVKDAEAKRKQKFVTELDEAQGDEDEEGRMWEEEQMRRVAPMQQREELAKKAASIAAAPRETVYIPNVIPIPAVNTVMTRLTGLVNNLEISHIEHLAQIRSSKSDLESSKTSAQGLQQDIKNASQKYTYFQEFKTYIQDLAEFLDTKFPELEKLEEDYHNLLREQSSFVMDRRDAILDDRLSDFSSYIPAEPQLRQSRQTAYTQRRTRRTFSQQTPTQEGLSSDDEVDEQLDIGRKKDAEKRNHLYLFADTLDEFCSIPIIKAKFESWKNTFRQEYEQSYGGLSMPGVFELYVRQELLAWEPFSTYLDLESMNWHESVMGYGMNPNAMEISEDEDVRLLPKIVEKVVIPRLVSRVDIYDPYSCKQTKLALRIVGQMLNYTESDSKAFKTLIGAFEARIDSVISAIVERQDVFGVRFNLPLSDQAIASRNAWFATLSKLYDNSLSWRRYIPALSLQSMVINKLLNRHLIPLFRDAPSPVTDVHKCLQLLQSIPVEWIGGGTDIPQFLRVFENRMKLFAEQSSLKVTDKYVQ